MPISFRIDTGHRLVLSIATGVLDDADLLDHQRRLSADSDFEKDLDQVYDFCDVTEVNVGMETIKKLADESPFGPGSRRAFIASSDLVFGLIRIFESRSEEHGHQMQVFRSRGDAAEWLGLESLLED